jgi:hypothetical protein
VKKGKEKETETVQNPGSLLLDKLPITHILAVSDLDSEGSEEREGEGNRNRPES